MKQNPYWFFEKWGIKEQPPINSILDRLEELENRVKVLEEENVSQSNALYEAWNSLDARIDILAENRTDV
jgi:hypothetical protein